MSRIPSIAITTGLIGSGVLAWAFAGRPLLANPDLNAPLNPLGINGSPYGEVFAMAMQSPIDNYFHAGMGGESHNHAPGETCSDASAHEHEHDESCKHEHHEHDETCEHGHDDHASSLAGDCQKSPALNVRLGNLLSSLDQVREVRTNPKACQRSAQTPPPPPGRGQTPLRLSTRSRPLRELQLAALLPHGTAVGTRPELTPSAAKLAQDTIDYCLKQDNDPRPALTAAAAATNILHLMFADRHNATPKYTTTQMRQCLGLLDHCLARYDLIAKQWDQSKNWDLLSPMRITECEERLSFITKIREAAEKTIIRLETNPKTPGRQLRVSRSKV